VRYLTRVGWGKREIDFRMSSTWLDAMVICIKDADQRGVDGYLDCKDIQILIIYINEIT